MAYDDMICPCGDTKMRETMLCLACEKQFEGHPEMTVFRDDVRYTVNSRRSAAIVILSLARRRKKAPVGNGVLADRAIAGAMRRNLPVAPANVNDKLTRDAGAQDL